METIGIRMSGECTGSKVKRASNPRAWPRHSLLHRELRLARTSHSRSASVESAHPVLLRQCIVFPVIARRPAWGVCHGYACRTAHATPEEAATGFARQ